MLPNSSMLSKSQDSSEQSDLLKYLGWAVAESDGPSDDEDSASEETRTALPPAIQELFVWIGHADPTYALFMDEWGVLERGFESIRKDLPDSPKTGRRIEVLNRVQRKSILRVDALARKKATTPLSWAERAESVYQIAANSDWFSAVMEEMAKSIPACRFEGDKTFQALRNHGHVERAQADPGGNPRGWHLCPPLHPDEGRIDRAFEKADHINPSSGVWVARFQKGAGSKYSTFFPRTILNLEELAFIMDAATPVLHQGNRSLLQATVPGQSTPVYVEQVERLGGALVPSYYPMVCYEEWKPHTEFQLTRVCKVTSEDVLTAANKVIALANVNSLDTNPIRYLRSEQVVVDIGHCFPPVEQGVLFAIPEVRLRDHPGFNSEAFRELTLC